MKIGTLMIPLPNAFDNHHLLNARYVEKDGMFNLSELKKLQ